MSKEQQISARIASLRQELDAASKPTGAASTQPTGTAEQLAADLRRRQESYIRRERSYEEQVRALQSEVDRLKAGRSEWMEQDEKVRNIREMHKQLLQNIENVQESTAKVLKDQERDLLRAFRARLFDIQSELELEKNKADVGASAWIEKNRQLERGLDWAKEMADRLERVNQVLQHENTKLKSQYKTQENDREFLIRQLVSVKKDNVQLRKEIEEKDLTIRNQQEEIDQLAAFKKQSISRTTGASPSVNSSNLSLPSAVHRSGSSDASQTANRGQGNDQGQRYNEIIKRLKKLLDTERSNLKKVRSAYATDLKTRTELEVLLRDCVEDVRVKIVKQRKLAGIAVEGSKEKMRRMRSEPALDANDLNSKDRERILEMLLSKERVITLLYKKAFPASKLAPTPSVVDTGLIDQSESEDPQQGISKKSSSNSITSPNPELEHRESIS